MNNTESTIIIDGNDVKGTIQKYLAAGKVEDAVALYQDNTKKVIGAIQEYNTDLHKIMFRPDKVRKDKDEFRTAKLARNWQQYINEVAAFFMLGNPLKWSIESENELPENEKDAFKLFMEFMDRQHYVSRNHEMKILAGAETEAAKLYAIYIDEGEIKVKTMILSKSKNYDLRALFNEYGDMKSFAVGYKAKDIAGNIMNYWDIYMADIIYHCVESADAAGLMRWTVKTRQNVVGKIPVIYAPQPKEWEGVQCRIEQDEWLDSKNADVVEYFGDPYLKISKNVKNTLAAAEEVGKLIEVTDKDDVFDYVTPPEASEMKRDEKSMLKESILQGSFTPDLSYENIKGLGAISGEAESKANVLGHIKKNNRRMIYDEIFERDKNLMVAILGNVLYPEKKQSFEKIRNRIKFTYQDPFMGVMDDNSEEIARWRDSGVMSIEACVEANRNIKNKELEVARIKKEQEEKTANELKSNTLSTNSKSTDNE